MMRRAVRRTRAFTAASVQERRDHRFGAGDEVCAGAFGAHALAADARAFEQQRQGVGEQFGSAAIPASRQVAPGGRAACVLNSSITCRAG